MNEERRCIKCKYVSVSPYESPCLGCVGTKHHPNFELKETKPDRSCDTCEFEKNSGGDYPCYMCYGRAFHPEYKPKQVYISTADNRKNDLLDAARYAMQAKDTESLYPTLQYTPIKVDPKELELTMEKATTQWPINRPLNPTYGITQYIDKDVKITTDLLKRVEAELEKKMKEPKNVIFNDPATIVFWHDGTKTVVKAIDEPFDPEKGLAMAIAKKYLGNKHEYYNVFKKYLKKYEKEQVKEIFANVDEVHETKEPNIPSCFGVDINMATAKCLHCSYARKCSDEYCKKHNIYGNDNSYGN